MTETLIKTLESVKGGIHVTADGRRVLLADCAAAVEVRELTDSIAALGGETYNVRTGYRVLLRCSDIETTRAVDTAFLRTASRFEFAGSFQRKDGVFENFQLDIEPETLDLCGGCWLFHVNGSGALVKKLIEL